MMEETQVKTQLIVIFPVKISSWCANDDDIAGAAAAAIATAAVTQIIDTPR